MIDPVSMRAMSDEMEKISLSLGGIKSAITGGVKAVGRGAGAVGRGLQSGVRGINKALQPAFKGADAVEGVFSSVTGIPRINRAARRFGEKHFLGMP